MIRADHLTLHKVIYFPRNWGNLMGQSTKRLSWKRLRVCGQLGVTPLSVGLGVWVGSTHLL